MAQDVLTSVSLGNSSALTHVSRALMSRICRKAIASCWSFATAGRTPPTKPVSSSPARDRVRIRRAAYQSLQSATEPHDLTWLVDAIYEKYIEEGVCKRSKKKDQQQRDKMKITGALERILIAPRSSCRSGTAGACQSA